MNRRLAPSPRSAGLAQRCVGVTALALALACGSNPAGTERVPEPVPERAHASGSAGSTTAPTSAASSATADPPAPGDAKSTPEDGANSLSALDCDALSDRFESEARTLARRCVDAAECSLLWSDYNCYALRSASDEVESLGSVDREMATKACSKVECEPPPLIACTEGRCAWKL